MAIAGFSASPKKGGTRGNSKGASKSALKGDRKGVVIATILLIPGMLYLALFFLTPLVQLVVTALESPDASGAIGAYVYDFNLQNFADGSRRP